MRSFRAFLAVAVVLGAAALWGPVAVAVFRGSGGAAGDEELQGLWTRWPEAGKREDAPVAFYYFHEGSVGLFRFGKIGFNTTNSYNWSSNGNTIVLRYRKTGLSARLPYRIEGAGAKRVLVVDDDTQNPGVAASRYSFVPFEQSASVAPDLFVEEQPPTFRRSPSPDRIDNRLWMDLKRYATGGSAFALYQLREAGIDGRGTGWHHVGDFDDWSTEALSYRLNTRSALGPGGQGAGARELDLLFTLRNERSLTAVHTGHRSRDGADVRFLTLQQDPRGFWAPHAFDDTGPSFGNLVVDQLADATW